MVVARARIRFEHRNTSPQSMAHIKQISVELLALEAGQRALELRCGAGMNAIAMRRLVGPSGEVHAVDYEEAMVTQARLHAEAGGVSAWVTHHHASASALPWPTDFFDASRTELVFQHLFDPESAFDELIRGTKPGGRIVVIDGE